jgi:N-acetylglutamate synthase/N-acetylornithine aminotransferase
MIEKTESLFGGSALILSTGVMGVHLPMEKVESGIQSA